MEPHNLNKWKLEKSPSNYAHFYACARPGRSLGQDRNVPDSMVSKWVRNLPGPNTTIVSLLGRKKNRRELSEFSHYSFFGGWDSPEERVDKLTFQEWVETYHGCSGVLVRERPTYDYQELSPFILNKVASEIRHLIPEGRTVVVVDSGGAGRVCEIATFMGAAQVPVNC